MKEPIGKAYETETIFRNKGDYAIDRQLGIVTCGIEEWDEGEETYHRYESTPTGRWIGWCFICRPKMPSVDYGAGLGASISTCITSWVGGWLTFIRIGFGGPVPICAVTMRGGLPGRHTLCQRRPKSIARRCKAICFISLTRLPPPL